MKQLSRSQVVAFRLARQHLGQDRLPRQHWREAAAVAVRNTAPNAAALALRARAPELTVQDLVTATSQDKSLVETWSLGQAPCLLRTKDLPVFTTGMQPDDDASWRAIMPGALALLSDVDRPVIEVVNLIDAALRDALHGGVALTRSDLADALGQRLPHDFADWCDPATFNKVTMSLVRAVALRGGFVSAPRQGNDMSIMATDAWLGETPDHMDRGEAQAELVRRFLRHHAPSTCEHFTTWTGMSPGTARRGWRRVSRELIEVGFGGEIGFALTDDEAALDSAPPPRGLRLLPPDDPYLQGLDRSTVAPDAALRQRIWQPAGSSGVVLADGEVIALWRYRKRGRKLVINVDPLVAPTAGIRRGLAAEAEPLAEFRDCLDVIIDYAD